MIDDAARTRRLLERKRQRAVLIRFLRIKGYVSAQLAPKPRKRAPKHSADVLATHYDDAGVATIIEATALPCSMSIAEMKSKLEAAVIYWAAEAQIDARSSNPPKADEPWRSFVLEGLKPIYEAAFKVKAATSRAPYGTESGGPFVRFVNAAIEPLDENAEISGNALRDILRDKQPVRKAAR